MMSIKCFTLKIYQESSKEISNNEEQMLYTSLMLMVMDETRKSKNKKVIEQLNYAASRF